MPRLAKAKTSKTMKADRGNGIVAIVMPEIKEKVRRAASQDHMTMSSWIRHQLTQILAANYKTTRKASYSTPRKLR